MGPGEYSTKWAGGGSVAGAGLRDQRQAQVTTRDPARWAGASVGVRAATGSRIWEPLAEALRVERQAGPQEPLLSSAGGRLPGPGPGVSPAAGPAATSATLWGEGRCLAAPELEFLC